MLESGVAPCLGKSWDVLNIVFLLLHGRVLESFVEHVNIEIQRPRFQPLAIELIFGDVASSLVLVALEFPAERSLALVLRDASLAMVLDLVTLDFRLTRFTSNSLDIPVLPLLELSQDLLLFFHLPLQISFLLGQFHFRLLVHRLDDILLVLLKLVALVVIGVVVGVVGMVDHFGGLLADHIAFCQLLLMQGFNCPRFGAGHFLVSER